MCGIKVKHLSRLFFEGEMGNEPLQGFFFKQDSKNDER